jgi:acyl-coenzyme A thioesterase PaaI-like protein
MTSTTATPYAGLRGLSARELQDFSRGSLPDWLGIELTSVQRDRLTCRAEATPVHLGRTTQVWDATITDEHTGRRLAIFRCTQMVLWYRPDGASRRFDQLGLAG